MLVTEQNGAQKWRQMLTENFNVTDQDKLNWVSQYASIHEIHESQLGINAGNVLNNAPQAVGPIYTTPLNTTGMGNPYAPGTVATPGFDNPQVPIGGTASFYNQSVGSGDIPVSTLPMALNVALLTIGLELVPVIPAKGPWHMLSYMDFPYAGGKLGRVNETSFDGKGDGNENKRLSAIVPQTLTYTTAQADGNVKFRITIYNDAGDLTNIDVYEADIKPILNSGKTAEVAPNGKWESGVHYVYNLKISKTEVKVTATLADWTTVNATQDIWF